MHAQPLTRGSGTGANGPVGQDADGPVSEVDITSTHDSVMSATPDSTIGTGQKLKYGDPSHMSGETQFTVNTSADCEVRLDRIDRDARELL